MEQISAIVITYNEEDNIADCLETLKWCDEIIIIDSKSTDKTIKIASKYTNKIFLTEDLPYSDKKNIGIEKAAGDWVLSVDADERITDDLKNEIKEILNSSHERFNAYFIRRKSFFINKFIKHCGWNPDYVLRFFRRSETVRFSKNLVHEKLLINDATGKLKSEMLHYTDRNFEHYVDKMNIYSTYSANELLSKQKKTGLLDIIFRPAFTFLKMYFLKLGFLDGYIGLALCILSGVHVFAKYSKHYFLTYKS